MCSSRTREQHFVNAPQCFVMSKEQYRESTLRMFRKSTKAVSRILIYLNVSYCSGGGIVNVPTRSVTDFIEEARWEYLRVPQLTSLEEAWWEYLSVLWLTSLKKNDKSAWGFCKLTSVKEHNESYWLVSWCFEPSQPQRITSGLYDESAWAFCDWLQRRSIMRIPERSVTDFNEEAW